MGDSCCIACLACGTRGDVQPLLALAVALLQSIDHCTVELVTHRAHRDWLEEAAQLAGIGLHFLASSPARVWTGGGPEPAQDGSRRDDELREELAAACTAALARAASRRRLIVFNLFALEGYHLAEALGVPCLAASPCLVPYAPPAGFERRFQQAHPRLLRLLRDADSDGSCSHVGWSAVRHWMWPLYAERWGAWRHHRLGLPAAPCSDATTAAQLPPAPLLLYGVSELVVPRPGHWPASVHACGFWSSHRCFPPRQLQLPAALDARLNAARGEGGAGSPVCVDFGSMGFMGLLPHPRLLAAVLHGAARILQRPVVLLTAGWQPLLDACSHLAGGRVLALEHPLSHDALLPRCAALLHHGGAGTVAAALRCGVPQLVCPLHFDQHQWAERVAWLGCGAQIGASTLLQAGGGYDAVQASAVGQGQQQGAAVDRASVALAEAVSRLLQDDAVRTQCAAMQRQLAGEDGLAAAVQLVRQQLERPSKAGSPPSAAAAPASVPAPAVQELLLPGGLQVLCISRPEALFIHREIFWDDCYRLGPGRGVRLPEGAVVLDVGANVGLFALRLLLDPDLGPRLHDLHAFEPLGPTADVLEANLRQHGVAERATVHRCGLHSRPGRLPFTFYPAMPGNSTCAPEEKWAVQRGAMAATMGWDAADACFQGASRVECPVTTLAEFVRLQQLGRIDLLKVDVEGAEMEVLRGMDRACWAATRQILVEVHSVGDRVAACQELLRGRGFEVEAAPGPGGNVLLFAARRGEEGAAH